MLFDVRDRKSFIVRTCTICVLACRKDWDLMFRVPTRNATSTYATWEGMLKSME